MRSANINASTGNMHISRHAFITLCTSIFLRPGLLWGEEDVYEQCKEFERRYRQIEKDNKKALQAWIAMRQRIVDVARLTLGSQDWAPTLAWTRSGRNMVFACNEYVAYVLRQSGAATSKPIERNGLFSEFRDPLANEWADTNIEIKGWSVVYPDKNYQYKPNEILALRQPGDIVAFAGSPMGHVGIVSDHKFPNECVFSASARTGKVECNRWSMSDLRGIYRAGEYEKALLKKIGNITVRRLTRPLWRPTGLHIMC